jgi:hypothetical protein
MSTKNAATTPKSKKSNKQDAAANAQAIASGLKKSSMPMLGTTIWWTIPQGLLFTRPEFEAKAKDNIGTTCLPSEPSNPRALRAALEAIEKDGFIRRIRNDSGILAFVLATEQVDQKNIDLDLIKQNVIIYDSNEDKLEIRKSHKKAEILAMFTKYQGSYTEDDIRTAVKRYLFANGAVTMRDSGGIYFVRQPEVHDALKSFLEACGCKFYSIPVPDVDAAKGTMTTIVQEELKRDLELAAEEVKALVGKENARTSTFETQVERFKTLRGKAEMYRDLLSNDLEAMNQKLTELTDEVMKALMGELEAYPQAAKFPLHSKVKYNGKAKEKYGTDGEVVGYWVDVNDPDTRQIIKVLFTSCQKIVNCSPAQLEIAS